MTTHRYRRFAALVAVTLDASAVRAETPLPDGAPPQGTTMLDAVGAPATSEGTATHEAAARALFERGRALLEEGRPEEACAVFAESHALMPTVATLLNLGVCHRRSGRFATALGYFRRAKAASSASGDEDRAAKAAQDEEEVALLVGTLTVRAQSPLLGDREVWMDGQLFPRSDWFRAMPLDAGDHQVEVRSGTRTIWSAHVLVANGAPSVCEIPKLAAEPEQTPKKVVPPPPPSASTHEASPRVPVASYVAGGLGLASFGVGLAFGVVAWGKYSEAEAACPTHTSCPTPSVQELYASAERAATAANVAAVIGAVSLGTGIVLYFTQGRRDEKQIALGVVTTPLHGGAGAALKGEF